MLHALRKLATGWITPPATGTKSGGATRLASDVPFPTPDHGASSTGHDAGQVHGFGFGILDRIVAATLFGCLLLSTAGCKAPVAPDKKKDKQEPTADLIVPQAPTRAVVVPDPPKAIDRRTEGNVTVVVEPERVVGEVAERRRLTSANLEQIAVRQTGLREVERDLLLVGRAHRTAPEATLRPGDSALPKRVLEDRELLEAHLITRWARIHDWLLEKDNAKGAAPILRSWLALGAVHPQLAKRVERDAKDMLAKMRDPDAVAAAIQAQPTSIAEPRTMPDHLRVLTGKGPETPAARDRQEQVAIKGLAELASQPVIDLDRVAELNPRLSQESLMLHHLARVNEATPKERRQKLDTLLDISDRKQVGIVLDAFWKDAEKHFNTATASREMAAELRAWLSLGVDVPELADRIGYAIGELLDRAPGKRTEVIDAMMSIHSPWWEAPNVHVAMEGLTGLRLDADIEAVRKDGQQYLNATAKENFGRLRVFVQTMHGRDRLTETERTNLEKVAKMIPAKEPMFNPWSATILDGEHFVNATATALDANATLRRVAGVAKDAPNEVATRATRYLVHVMRQQAVSAVNSYQLSDEKAESAYRAAMRTLPRDADGKLSQSTRDLLSEHEKDLNRYPNPRAKRLVVLLNDFLGASK